MSISQAKRIELHQQLREKLTVNAADTLMDHLPPGGWSDVATKSDIELLRSETAVLITSTKTDIELLRSEMAVQQASTQKELALVRKDLQLLEARLIEKLDKTIIKQNRWMIGILGSLVVAMIIALVR